MSNDPLDLSLVVEGDGDAAAVPELVRKVLSAKGKYGLSVLPDPIRRVGLGSLLQPGQIERFVSYAASKDAGAVLVAVDNDDHCTKLAVLEIGRRCRALDIDKKIGICFFTREFEALFLICLKQIADKYPDYKWNLADYDPEEDFERVRNAKERISRFMAKDKAYKETRDQVKFINALDFDLLRERSRSFRHFENTLEFLLGSKTTSVYP